MNRHQRRAAAARTKLQACTPENLAKAAMMADQAGQPGVAELMRQVRRGNLALFFASDRNQVVTAAELSGASRPTIAVVGDDDYRSTGPGGWSATPGLTEWAAAAVVHAAASTADTYSEAVKAARLFGRAVLVETSSDHAAEWAMAFYGRPVLLVLPTEGPHPVLPPKGRMH